MTKLIFTLLLISPLLLCQNTNSSLDLLSGKGKMTKQNFDQNWKINTTQHSLNFSIYNASNRTFTYVEMTKKPSASLSFHDGYYINFKESQPKHLTFYFSSKNREIEDTNLRLKNSKVEISEFQSLISDQ